MPRRTEQPAPATDASANVRWPTYLAECFWPGVSEAKLAAAAGRTAHDRTATCLEVILIPADEIVLCLFQAPSQSAVTTASRRAGLPSERVVESLRIRPGVG
jgi:uncharacterized protein DUF4242